MFAYSNFYLFDWMLDCLGELIKITSSVPELDQIQRERIPRSLVAHQKAKLSRWGQYLVSVFSSHFNDSSPETFHVNMCLNLTVKYRDGVTKILTSPLKDFPEDVVSSWNETAGSSLVEWVQWDIVKRFSLIVIFLPCSRLIAICNRKVISSVDWHHSTITHSTIT